MDTDVNKQIEDRFKALPEPLQRAIALTDWKKNVAEIAKANNLSADQAQSLETEAMLVMYSFSPQEELQTNLARELNIEQARAKMLSDEVMLKVFSIVLAKADRLAKEKDTLQTASTTPTMPEPASSPKVFEAKPGVENPPVNILPPKPKAEEPLELLPPKVEPIKASLPEPPKKAANPAYPDGVDPYRETV